MFNERYFIDEEKKVVVCKLTNCANSLIFDMHKKGWPIEKELLIRDTFVGKSKCLPLDDFDIERGKEIAYNRAIVKLNASKKKVLTKFVSFHTECYNAIIKDTDELCNRYEATMLKKTENVQSILESFN